MYVYNKSVTIIHEELESYFRNKLNLLCKSKCKSEKCKSNCETKKYKYNEIIEMQTQLITALLKVLIIPKEADQVNNSTLEKEVRNDLDKSQEWSQTQGIGLLTQSLELHAIAFERTYIKSTYNLPIFRIPNDYFNDVIEKIRNDKLSKKEEEFIRSLYLYNKAITIIHEELESYFRNKLDK